jgi:hypothetical protein
MKWEDPRLVPLNGPDNREAIGGCANGPYVYTGPCTPGSLATSGCITGWYADVECTSGTDYNVPYCYTGSAGGGGA